MRRLMLLAMVLVCSVVQAKDIRWPKLILNENKFLDSGIYVHPPVFGDGQVAEIKSLETLGRVYQFKYTSSGVELLATETGRSKCSNGNYYKSHCNKAWPQSSPHIFLATSVCISTKILGHVNVVRNGIGSRGGIKSQ